jgi:hypothetical protein
MFFWIIVGIAIGYFFKPQLDKVVKKVIKMVKENKDDYKIDDDDKY